jgi:hypothetical protein
MRRTSRPATPGERAVNPSGPTDHGRWHADQSDRTGDGVPNNTVKRGRWPRTGRRDLSGSHSLYARPVRRRVRVGFGLLLVAFVVQLAVARVAQQPYPGLFQPGFPGRSVGARTMTVRQPAVTVTYTDGSTTTFTHLQVMAQSRSLPLAVFRSAFGPDSPRRSDPDTIAWLERRLSDLGGGRRPDHAVLSWRAVVYDLDDERPPRVTTTDRTVISFGGERG